MAQRIRIRLKAFDHVVLDQAAADIVPHCGEDRRAGVGPHPAAGEDGAVDGSQEPARGQEEP